MYLPTELEEGGWTGEVEGADFVDRVKSSRAIKSVAREDLIARDEEADEDKEE